MREPDAALLDVEHDRVADDDAVLVGDQRVPAAAGLQLRQVAGREPVGERQRVGPGQLDLALGPDVPEGHALGQRAVLRGGLTAVVHRHVHVVVGHVGNGPGGLGAVEVRRAPHVGEKRMVSHAAHHRSPPSPGAFGRDPRRLRHRTCVTRHAGTPPIAPNPAPNRAGATNPVPGTEFAMAYFVPGNTHGCARGLRPKGNAGRAEACRRERSGAARPNATLRGRAEARGSAPRSTLSACGSPPDDCASRRSGLGDIAAFVAYRRDPRSPGTSRGSTSYSADDAARLVAAQPTTELPTAGDWLQLALHAADDGRLVGDVAVHRLADQPDTFEVGVTLAPGEHGRGYGTEAVTGVIEALFSTHGAHRVIAGCDARNDAVRALLARVGMRRNRASSTPTGSRASGRRWTASPCCGTNGSGGDRGDAGDGRDHHADADPLVHLQPLAEADHAGQRAEQRELRREHARQRYRAGRRRREVAEVAEGVARRPRSGSATARCGYPSGYRLASRNGTITSEANVRTRRKPQNTPSSSVTGAAEVQDEAPHERRHDREREAGTRYPCAGAAGRADQHDAEHGDQQQHRHARYPAARRTRSRSPPQPPPRRR